MQLTRQALAPQLEQWRVLRLESQQAPRLEWVSPRELQPLVAPQPLERKRQL